MLKEVYAVTDATMVTEGYPRKGNKDRRVKKTLKSNLKLTNMALEKGLGGEKKWSK